MVTGYSNSIKLRSLKKKALSNALHLTQSISKNLSSYSNDLESQTHFYNEGSKTLLTYEQSSQLFADEHLEQLTISQGLQLGPEL